MKVLVVNDNKKDRLHISKIVLTHGFDVSEAGNGYEALEKVETEPPDIIISDIMMPEMDGFMLIRKIKGKEKTKDIPFIFYTKSFVCDEDRKLGFSLGAARFIVKPLKPEGLLCEIDLVLNEHKTGKLKSAGPEITDTEYLQKYSAQLSLKLESRVRMLEQEIEKRKKIEAELRNSEKKLILAKDEALRASSVKSDFLMKMSHELRTPLNSVLGFSQILKMKQHGELNEKQEKHVDNIFYSATRLLGMINDMLDLVKVESGEGLHLSIRSFQAPEAIDEALIFISDRAEQKKIVVQKEIDPGLGIIEADTLRFKQILINLIDNAIKFSKPDGGTVNITAGKNGNMVQFSISDTGIGIKEKEMSKLFDPFYQADSGINRRYGGAGAGLAVTKKLVEQHGGRIWVESIYSKGSTFSFTLPLKQKNRSILK
ncbi:MAG: ATP-binding protein [Candidatus Methanoperedens sp.]|nr:ATP-binding protein [Candidatus Methanoperedens sp.]